MNYWWVNHKQTFAHENAGGYIWSPQKKSNGSLNQAYTNLTLTQIGDLVFSYAYGAIKAVGVVVEKFQVADRPIDFGKVGDQWDQQGWLVKVDWLNLKNPIKPKDHIIMISPLLPTIHSPIQMNGNGNQGVYLAGISSELANTLLELIRGENDGLISQLKEATDNILEEIEIRSIVDSHSIAITDKPQLIKARVGQGLFRDRVQKIEKGCRLTRVTDGQFLIASHIKPWRCCTNQEKLDGHNGLMLSPHIDKLFDKGWITFSDKGDVIIKDDSLLYIMNAWGLLLKGNVGPFSEKQKEYLAFHREHIFQGNYKTVNILEL